MPRPRAVPTAVFRASFARGVVRWGLAGAVATLVGCPHLRDEIWGTGFSGGWGGD